MTCEKDLVERRIHRFDIAFAQARMRMFRSTADTTGNIPTASGPSSPVCRWLQALHRMEKTLIARNQNLIDILIEHFHRLCR